ncbi:hypothetical protein LN042_10990 [Kitasatospora sp. RB6PN24]|nr:hypothetical protein [Kitasatospora humi]MCC9307621.1 hypothetical protein [Kitasatospora humi]
MSEPHWHASRAESLLDTGGFERVLASVHSAATAGGAGFTEVSECYQHQPPEQVVRDYLHETVRLIEQFDRFEVLAHIDYPVRHWPLDAKPYDPRDFEDEYRQVLSRLAAAGKVLEVNTRMPLDPLVLRWWRQEGGRAIAFASDAHSPDAVARDFGEAVRLAEAAGFRAAREPYDFWRCG